MAPRRLAVSYRTQSPRATTSRRLGGHRIGHTFWRTVQIVWKTALPELSSACLGRRGALLRIQSPRPTSASSFASFRGARTPAGPARTRGRDRRGSDAARKGPRVHVRRPDHARSIRSDRIDSASARLEPDGDRGLGVQRRIIAREQPAHRRVWRAQDRISDRARASRRSP